MTRTFGHEANDHTTGARAMFLDFWLTITRQPNGKPQVKASAGYPALGRNERAINLKMQLPLALFETPSLTASIVVEHPTQAIVIDATAVAEAVRQVVGMDVAITVGQPGGGE